MTQFATALPKDSDGQKTTSVPTGTSTIEWVTPVVKTAGHLDSVLLPSTAETASAQTAATNVAGYTMGVFFLSVTAVSGTSPTLNVTIEGQDPASSAWFTIGTFNQLTAVGSQRITIPQLLDSNVRVNYQIGGTTPSFTLSVGATFKA